MEFLHLFGHPARPLLLLSPKSWHVQANHFRNRIRCNYKLVQLLVDHGQSASSRRAFDVAQQGGMAQRPVCFVDSTRPSKLINAARPPTHPRCRRSGRSEPWRDMSPRRRRLPSLPSLSCLGTQAQCCQASLRGWRQRGGAVERLGPLPMAPGLCRFQHPPTLKTPSRSLCGSRTTLVYLRI